MHPVPRSTDSIHSNCADNANAMNYTSFNSTKLLSFLSITSEHAIDKISQWAPEILSTSKVVLIDEKNVMLEAGVEMGLQTELADDRVVVAVDVGINTVHSFEDLANHARECLRERNTCVFF